MEGAHPSRRGAARATAVALLFTGLGACTAREVDPVELSSYAFEYAFLVVYDATGEPTRVTQPFGVKDGRVTFGSPPALDLAEDERGLVLVGLGRRDLDTVPGFDPARIEELRVLRVAPPSTPAFDPSAADGSLRLAEIPDGALLLGSRVPAIGAGAVKLEPVTKSAVAALGKVTLQVPVDPEWCRVPNETPFEKFGATRDVLTAYPGADIASLVIMKLGWLDPTHLVALTVSNVVVLEAGQPFRGVSALINEEGPTQTSGVFPRSMAVDPTSSPGGRRRVVAVAGRVDRPEGFVWELLADPDRVELIEKTVFPVRVSSVVIDEEGTVLVATSTGAVLARRRGETDFRPHSLIEVYSPDEKEFVQMIATGDPEYPLLAGSRARLHVFDAAEGRWRWEQLLLDGLAAAEPVEPEALAAGRTASGALELWAGAQHGVLYRRIGHGAWERVRLVYPPRFEVCGGRDPMTGEIVFDRDFRGLAVGGDYLHAAPGLCQAVLQVRRRDLCTSVLPHDAEIAHGAFELNALLTAPGRLVAGGVPGRVLTATW